MAYHSIMIPGTDQTTTGFIGYEDASGDYFQATTEANGDEFCEVFDPLENAVGSQKKTRKTKSKDITLDQLKLCFELPVDTAAKMFGVGRTTFRTRCRELGISEWPYKKRNVNTVVHDQLREVERFLMDIDTCPEMDYEAAGNHPALDLLMKDLAITSARAPIPETQIDQKAATKTGPSQIPVDILKEINDFSNHWSFDMDMDIFEGLCDIPGAQINQSAPDEMSYQPSFIYGWYGPIQSKL